MKILYYILLIANAIFSGYGAALVVAGIDLPSSAVMFCITTGAVILLLLTVDIWEY